jgi:transposase
MEHLETCFKQTGTLPMVKYYMDELDLFNLFKKYVPATSGCFAEHAESLCILTANIICDNKPLYKIQEWLSKYSDGLIDEPIEATLFNDDRLANSLSALFNADRHSLMTELSSHSIRVHKLMTDQVHNDSTTVTFSGNYKDPDPDAVQFKHGHNKDFRPDCKQVVFGLNIVADGRVPISFELFDGNRNDDTTHIPNWNGLRALLGKEDFIYIADCKLCSKKNLAHIDDNGGVFITIVPKSRNEVKQFYTFLETADVEWKDGYEVESTRKKGKALN